MDRQYPIDNVRGWIVKRPILSLSLAALVALLAGVGIGIAGAGDSEAEDLRGELAELEAERDQLAEDLKTAEEEAWENRQEVLDLRAELRGDDEPEPAEESPTMTVLRIKTRTARVASEAYTPITTAPHVLSAGPSHNGRWPRTWDSARTPTQ